MKMFKLITSLALVCSLAVAGICEAKGSFGGGSRSTSMSRSFSTPKAPTKSFTTPAPTRQSKVGSFGTKAAVVGTGVVATGAVVAAEPSVTQSKMTGDIQTTQEKQNAVKVYNENTTKPSVVSNKTLTVPQSTPIKPYSIPPTSYGQRDYRQPPTAPVVVNNDSGGNLNSAMLGYMVGSTLASNDHSGGVRYVEAPTNQTTTKNSESSLVTQPATIEKEQGSGLFNFLVILSLLVIATILAWYMFFKEPVVKSKYSFE